MAARSETSAGGFVYRGVGDGCMVLLGGRRRPPKGRLKWGLPKGHVEPGETLAETAIREVREETGLIATPIKKLIDIKYVYVRSWGDKQRVFKIVSFYLLKYQSGNIDEIDSAMRIEVKRALWIPLEDAGLKLAYRGERDVIRQAQEFLQNHPEV